MRTEQSGWTPADIAERISDVDDTISTEQQRLIDERVEAMLTLKLHHEPGTVNDLLPEMDAGTHICRALRNLDAAINSDSISERQIAKDAVFTALTNLQRDLDTKCRSWWEDECRQQAEQEILG